MIRLLAVTVKTTLRAACLAVFLLGIASSAHPEHILAVGEFQADYDIQYAVSPNGKTIVTQQVTLTNRLPNFYPQEYSLLIDSDKINNIIAYDDGGVITPSISVKDGKTRITLTFNVRAIGLGRTLPFSLRYEHNGIANKAGSIWEIYVPGVVNDPDISAYNVTLSVPPSFGPAAYLSPLPAHGNTWTKDQMTRGGIAGAYGSSQKFSVSLAYELSNPRSTSQVQEIALPPDTAYQASTLTSIEPAPDTVIRDEDGNWIARYTLPPRQTVRVRAVFGVSTFLNPRKEFVTSDIDRSKLTAPQEYWDTSDERIVALGKRYATPRAVYDYVVSALNYDYDKVNATATRLGALGALNTPKAAVCMEFTDLFVAVARAAGIPARRIVGYAYTSNPKLRPLSFVSDVLHAWPEYYDDDTKVWVPVDPTWANTTGGVDYFSKTDFNHIVFAINGSSSTVPYPAGYYRSAGTTGRDVDVQFADTTSSSVRSDIVSVIDFPDQAGAGTVASGFLTVSNRGSISAGNIPVSIQTEPGSVTVDRMIDELLPMAVERIPISVPIPQSLQASNGRISARVGDAMISKSFSIHPLYWRIAAYAAGILSGIILLVLLVPKILWRIRKK